MHGGSFFNIVKVLKITLRNGMAGTKQVGPKTGDPTTFTSMDQLIDAFRTQMAYFIKCMARAERDLDEAHQEGQPLSYQSSLIANCIRLGRSAQEGGALYNWTGAQGVGIANVADALMAIKRLVFEEKKLSMEKVFALTASNFGRGREGDCACNAAFGGGADDISLTPDAKDITPEEGEYWRNYILNRIPKYGNDILEVDTIAREVGYIYCTEVEKYENARGGRFMAGLYPVSSNVPMGRVCAACADGRLSGEPLADGVSPSPGRDSCGPTAALASVARLAQDFAGNGALLNQKFHPSALAGEEGLENLVSLVRTYFQNQGSHVQFNVIDRATLLDAQAHPEKHRNLVVRVAGYSAHFVTLNRAIQNDIISRTEQVF